ncbi:MAG TPA: hypothetical protein VKQ72_01220 [Aggregatilineales bacterium]|nr:hypothetical protein [Aggregatilineales bacterium]
MNQPQSDFESGEQFDSSFSGKMEQPIPPDSLDALPDLPSGESVYDLERPTLGRLERLSLLIEEYPDEASNYVLRGEIFLDGGMTEQAADDFRKALDLADSQAKTANWGYILEALADRARNGLRAANFTAKTTI